MKSVMFIMNLPSVKGVWWVNNVCIIITYEEKDVVSEEESYGLNCVP